MTTPLNLARTAAALAQFDATADYRQGLWDKADTAALVWAADAADAAALAKVRDAFALDTADRNSPERAQLAPLPWLRLLCRSYVDGLTVNAPAAHFRPNTGRR